MPLDELLVKYQWTGRDDDDDAGLFPYSPASLSDASDTTEGKQLGEGRARMSGLDVVSLMWLCCSSVLFICALSVRSRH